MRSRIRTSFNSTSTTTSHKTHRPSNPGKPLAKQAIAQAILDKHDAATGGRRFNALLATASINDAIKYYEVFKQIQAQRRANDPEFIPLKIAAVFSPPAEGNKDIQQIQEDLPQEQKDNLHEPETKKTALKAIIADYNRQYGTNHDINNFDGYYQDIQQRIKDQKFPNRDLRRKGAEKIDITIVVDMLLTGFDAKFLNTLYVDKNLKHHGLIQAFSRTNRVLNATKPYGNILDFRQQQDSVDAAIALFSGEQPDQTREIWLVDKAPVVIDNFRRAVAGLGEFMQLQGLEARPDQVNNLKGDDARALFINRFKEIQRLQIQLDQYTDLTDEQRAQIKQILPKDDLRAFRGAYLETALRLKTQRGEPGMVREPAGFEADQLDFEFVLFASAVIDYDYIMKLIGQVLGSGPKEGPDHSRAAHRADPVRRQVPRRTRRDYRVRPFTEGGRGPRRSRDPRRLPEVQGRETGKRNRRPRPEARSDDSVSLGLRRHHSPAHDLRRRAAHRPDGAA